MNKLIFSIVFVFAFTSCNCQNFFWSHTGGAVACTEGYGLIYNWYAATDVRNIAPSGWHVPSQAELTTLQTYLGGEDVAGDKMKVSGVVYWLSGSVGNNSSGFNGKGAGVRTTSFSLLNSSLFVMTTTQASAGYHYIGILQYSNDNFSVSSNTASYTGRSIRLICDSSTDPGIMTGNDGKVYRTVKIGNQVWQADNSAETRFRNGNIIPYHGADNGNNFTNAEWAALVTPGVCAYGSNVANVGCNFVFP